MAASAPVIRTFQLDSGGVGSLGNSVNLFRGDVTFPLALVSLPGRSGLDVTVTALYSSHVHDQVNTWNLDAPTGILGLGWSMPIETILVDTNGTGSPYDDTYYLVSGGSMNPLVFSQNNADGSLGFMTRAYEFWRISYYQSAERWEITKENGVTYVYGDSASGRQTLQWGVGWGNYLGNSAQMGGQNYVLAWNLSQIDHFWGDRVLYEYVNDEQTVGGGPNPLSYTRASYLGKVTDVYGRTVSYTYADKVFSPPDGNCEYQVPHVVPSGETNAYQDRYETQYLQSLEVASASGSPLFSIHFGYDLVNVASGDSDGTLVKRYLTSMAQVTSGGQSLPGMQFSYYSSSSDVHPGALQTVTYPEGGTVTYTYSQQQLIYASKALQVDIPGGAPRVWWGPDYVVITSYDGSQLSIQAYSWAGSWYSANIDSVSCQLQAGSLLVLAEDDFFAVSYTDTASGQTVLLYNVNPAQFGQWSDPYVLGPYSGGSGTSLAAVASGDGFIAMNPAGTTDLYVYNWDPVQQIWSPAPSASLSATQNVLAGQDNYFLAFSYDPDAPPGTATLYFLDETGNWGSTALPNLNGTVYAPDGTPALVWSLGAGFAVATYVTSATTDTVQYALAIYQWDPTFTNITSWSYPEDQPSYSIPNTASLGFAAAAAAVQDSVVANAQHLLRYDGVEWWEQDLVESLPDGAQFAYGPDIGIITVEGGPIALQFDPCSVPNGPGWNALLLADANGEGINPTASGDYATVGSTIYYRGPASQWQPLATGLGGVSGATVLNRAPVYIACQTGAGTAANTCILVLQNGQALVNDQSQFQGQAICPSLASGPGTALAGPRAFVTYPAEDGDLDTATSLMLYRIADDSLDAAQIDYPVTSLTVADGYQSVVTDYWYDLTTATYDASGSTAQYSVARRYPGGMQGDPPTGQAGYTESHFFSGLNPATGFPNQTAQDSYSQLNGAVAYTKTFDASGNLTACSLYYYTALQPAPNGYPLPGMSVVKIGAQRSASDLALVASLPDDSQTIQQSLEAGEVPGIVTTTLGLSANVTVAIEVLYASYLLYDIGYDKMYLVQVVAAGADISLSFYSGVTSSVVNAYDPSTGLINNTSTFNIADYGSGAPQLQTIQKTFTYAYNAQGGGEYLYPGMRAQHLMTPVIQTVAQVNEQVVGNAITIWREWNEPGGGQWAPSKTGTALTGSAQIDFTRFVLSTPLFTLAADPAMQQALDATAVPPALQEAFQSNGAALSAAVSVSVEAPGSRYLLYDRGNAQVYVVGYDNAAQSLAVAAGGDSASPPPLSGWRMTSEILSRTSCGAVREASSTEGVHQATIFDAADIYPVATVGNASVVGQTASFFGFESYENPGGWQIQPGNQALAPCPAGAAPTSPCIAPGDVHTGESALLLPPSPAQQTGLQNTVQLQPGQLANAFLLSFWYKTQEGFGADPGNAAWTITFAQTGRSLPPSISLALTDTDATWTYGYQVIDVGQLVQDAQNDIDPDSPLDMTLGVLNQKATTSVLLDDLRLSPFVGTFSATVYSPDTMATTATLGTNGETMRYVRDTFSRVVASVGPAENVNAVAAIYYSRDGNGDGFSATDPNGALHIQARSGGSYDGFQTGNAWQTRWLASNASTNWAVADGGLVHLNGTPDTLTLRNAPASASYGLRLTLRPLALLSNPVGIRLGDQVLVQWLPPSDISISGVWECGANQRKPSRSFSIGPQYTDDLNGNLIAPLREVFAAHGVLLGAATTVYFFETIGSWLVIDSTNVQNYYVTPETTALTVAPVTLGASELILLIAGGSMLFYADGQLLFGQPLGSAAGPLQLFTADHIRFEDIAVFEDPQMSMVYATGGKKTTQTQVLEAGNCIVAQTLYDPLGRPDVRTKPAPYADTLFGFQPGFAALNRTTWAMTGDVATYYGGPGNVPNDAGYPYVQTVFESSPMSRVTQRGLPGPAFAVGAGGNTVRLDYGANDGRFGLTQGQYHLRTAIDPTGITTYDITDKLGQTVLKATVLDAATDSCVLTSMERAYTPTGLSATIRLPNYYNPPPSSQPEDWLLCQQYDFLGQEVQQTAPDQGTGLPPADRTTQFIYDSMGRLRFTQGPQGADPEGAGQQAPYLLYYKYDVLGRSAERGYLPYTWDAGDLQGNADDPSWPPTPPTWRQQIVYDGDGSVPYALGRPSLILSSNNDQGAADVTEEFAFDIRGRVISHTTTVSGTGTAFDGQPNTVSYAYDNLGRVSMIAYPDATPGTQVFYTYDDLGRLAAIGTAPGSAAYAAYAYNADGTLQSETLKGAATGCITRTHTYNSAGWPLQTADNCVTETLQYSSGSPGGSHFNGDIAQATYAFQWPGAPGGYSYQYQYDNGARLVTAENTALASGDVGVGAPVTYDDNGNIGDMQVGAEARVYTYVAGSNRLQNTDGGADVAFAYDADGKVISAARSTPLTIAYDPGRQLPVAVQVGGSATPVTFTYGGRGQRVIKASDGGATARLYLHGMSAYPLVEKNVTGGAVAANTVYIYAPGGLVAMKVGASVSYVLRDHERSTRAVVDSAGTVVAAYDYMPFGALLRAWGSTGLINYQYTGQEYDPETGLYNYRARLYDADLGRFYAPDPAGQFASPYLYAGDDPVLFLDPTGEWSWQAFVGLLVGVYEFLAGVALTVLTGGALAEAGGGTLMGAGLAAISYSVMHVKSFSWKDYGIHTGIGALSGTVGSVIGAGFSAAASAAMAGADLSASVAASVVSGIVVGAATGATSGVVNKIISNEIGDVAGLGYHSWDYGLGDAAWEGALAGGVGGGIAGGVAARSARLSASMGPRTSSDAEVYAGMNVALGKDHPTFDDVRGIIPRETQNTGNDEDWSFEFASKNHDGGKSYWKVSMREKGTQMVVEDPTGYVTVKHIEVPSRPRLKVLLLGAASLRANWLGLSDTVNGVGQRYRPLFASPPG